MTVDQGAALAVGHRHRQTAHRGRHHRGAAGLSLHRDQTEGLRIAGHRHQVGCPVEVDQLVARLRRQEGDPVSDTELVGQPNQRVRGGQAGAGGPPAMTTRTSGSSAAARNSTSGAFSGWMRPTKATIRSPAGNPGARARRRSPV